MLNSIFIKKLYFHLINCALTYKAFYVILTIKSWSITDFNTLKERPNMKPLYILLFLLCLSPISSHAGFNDNYFIIGIDTNIGSKSDAINVNVREPSQVEDLSLQGASTLALGMQFNFTPKFGTELSIVKRYSRAGETESNNAIGDIFENFFDCFFGLFCDGDDSRDFESATFSPTGLQVVPFYKAGNFNLGAGLVFYGSDSIEVEYRGDRSSAGENIDIKQSSGLVMQGDLYFREWLALSLKYESIDFKAGESISDINGNLTNRINGDHFSIGLKARF